MLREAIRIFIANSRLPEAKLFYYSYAWLQISRLTQRMPIFRTSFTNLYAFIRRLIPVSLISVAMKLAVALEDGSLVEKNARWCE